MTYFQSVRFFKLAAKYGESIFYLFCMDGEFLSLILFFLNNPKTISTRNSIPSKCWYMLTGKIHSDIATGCLTQSVDIDQSPEGFFCEFTITGKIHSESNLGIYQSCMMDAKSLHHKRFIGSSINLNL